MIHHLIVCTNICIYKHSHTHTYIYIYRSDSSFPMIARHLETSLLVKLEPWETELKKIRAGSESQMSNVLATAAFQSVRGI